MLKLFQTPYEHVIHFLAFPFKFVDQLLAYTSYHHPRPYEVKWLLLSIFDKCPREKVLCKVRSSESGQIKTRSLKIFRELLDRPDKDHSLEIKLLGECQSYFALPVLCCYFSWLPKCEAVSFQDYYRSWERDMGMGKLKHHKVCTWYQNSGIFMNNCF